jgi:hypothetical protein
MNDDELGRVLGTALTAPPLVAAPAAGPRLRDRARRDRTRRAVLAVAVAAVAVLTAGLVRWAVPAPPVPAAGPGAARSLLSTPLTIGPGVPCTVAYRFCPAAQATAVPVDEVVGTPVAVGSTVVLRVTATDSDTVAGLTTDRSMLQVRAGGGPVLRGALADYELRIEAGSAAAATGLVERLGAHPPPEPRTGPGPLPVPLEIWTVTDATTIGACPAGAAPPGTLVVDRRGECLRLAGPGVRLRTADLGLAGPDRGHPDWRVTVGVAVADRPALAAYLAAHRDGRVVYLAAGRVVAGEPDVTRDLMPDVLDLGVDDRSAGAVLVARLRP